MYLLDYSHVIIFKHRCLSDAFLIVITLDKDISTVKPLPGRPFKNTSNTIVRVKFLVHRKLDNMLNTSEITMQLQDTFEKESDFCLFYRKYKF